MIRAQLRHQNHTGVTLESPAGYSQLGTQDSRLKTQDFSRAFTLVELIVVIGIIVILAGLLVSASVTFARKSEVSQTETMLEQLTIILQEWELAVDRQLMRSENGDLPSVKDIADLHSETEEPFEITELLNTVARPSTIRDMVGGIDADFIRTYRTSDPQPSWLKDTSQFNAMKDDWAVDNNNGEQSLGLVILDRWDKPLRVIHSGRVADPTPTVQGGFGDNPDDADTDGTIRTEVENKLGVAVNRQLCFVSAGPDGKFGDLHMDIDPAMLTDTEQSERDLAMDNIYSYPVITEKK